MSVRPVSHFIWQVLRTVKRSKSPSTGKKLRVAPTRQTKDGSFLTELVGAGLLVRVTGSADAPFEATYSLTPLGEYAAEYGQYDHDHQSGSPPPPPTAEADRIDPKLLIGRWKPRKEQSVGATRTVEYTESGGVVDRTRVRQKYSSDLGRYRVEGNKLVVSRGDTELPPLTIAVLTDTELVTKNKDGREEKFERVEE